MSYIIDLIYDILSFNKSHLINTNVDKCIRNEKNEFFILKTILFFEIIDKIE